MSLEVVRRKPPITKPDPIETIRIVSDKFESRVVTVAEYVPKHRTIAFGAVHHSALVVVSTTAARSAAEAIIELCDQVEGR